MAGRQEQTVRIQIRTIRYLIYIPDGDGGADALAECLAYAEREHPEWIFAGVVAGRWTAVIAMIAQDLADVIVIARRSHLPADRLPRVIAVEEQLSGPPPRDSRRPASWRPRIS